jgi:hypothetical protein
MDEEGADLLARKGPLNPLAERDELHSNANSNDNEIGWNLMTIE